MTDYDCAECCCVQFWYFAQAFKGFGALVLMIENVINDSKYFLMLAFLVLVGFGLALFTVLQYCVDSELNETYSPEEENHIAVDEQSLTTLIQDDKQVDAADDDIEEVIKSDFRSSYRAILTMFYAMVGTFNPEVSFVPCA